VEVDTGGCGPGAVSGRWVVSDFRLPCAMCDATGDDKLDPYGARGCEHCDDGYVTVALTDAMVQAGAFAFVFHREAHGESNESIRAALLAALRAGEAPASITQETGNA
jgi:hypothetical protein